MKELNRDNLPADDEIEANLNTLLHKINIIREEYGKPMIVTSGLRSKAKQQGLIAAGKSNAVHSWHLVGAAVDIFDPAGELYDWCKAHTSLLEDAGLWLEERMGGWQHFQIYPPHSNRRWFWP